MRPIRLIATAATVGIVAFAWWFLAPPMLGGSTHYVVAAGTSMEPRVHGGDLVLARTKDAYEVGDVVLYESASLGRGVLHRIVSIEGDRLVTKGDGNSYRDPEHPSWTQVLGAQWIRIPYAGRGLVWLRHPASLGIAAFLVALLFLGAGREVSRRPTVAWPARALQPSLVVAGVLGGVAFAVLGLSLAARDDTRLIPAPRAWIHAGRFSYEATAARSAVYPDGRVRTGDVVFTRLVRTVDVVFDYRFASASQSDVRGAIGLDAVVSDGQGWSRSLGLAVTRPFRGATARIQGRLDLRRLGAMLERVRASTGLEATTFTVAIAPRVEVAGSSGISLVDETFTPQLALSHDGLALRPVAADGRAAAFEPREEGEGRRSVAGVVRVGPATLTVAQARAAAFVAAAAWLACGLVAALALRPDRRSGPGEGIPAALRGRVVNGSAAIPPDRFVTDVASIDELASIARHYDRVVLHVDDAGFDTYLVDDGVAIYRLRMRAERRLSSLPPKVAAGR